MRSAFRAHPLVLPSNIVGAGMDHALHHACDPSLEFEGELDVQGEWPAGIDSRFDLAERRVRARRVSTPDLAVLDGLMKTLPAEQWWRIIQNGVPSLTNTSSRATKVRRSTRASRPAIAREPLRCIAMDPSTERGEPA